MAPYQRQALVNAMMGRRGGRPPSVAGIKPPPYSNVPEMPERGPWQGGGGDFHNNSVPDITGNPGPKGPWMGGGGDFINTRPVIDLPPRTGGLDPNPYYTPPIDPPKTGGLDPNPAYQPPLDAAIATQNLFNTMQPGYVPPANGITPLPGGEMPVTPGFNGWSKSPEMIPPVGGAAIWNKTGDFGPGGNVVNDISPPAPPLAQPNAQKGMLGLGSALNKNFLARPGGGR